MTDAPVRVLRVEDVATEAEIELRELRRAGMRVAHRLVETEEAFREALRDFAPQVILSDFSMPRFDGMAALAIARERAPDIPFIFVSGTIGEEYAIRALKNGATDYVLKTNLVRLPPAVERALAEANERLGQRRVQEELDRTRERLTSIFNTLPDMLWSLDASAERVLFASPAALYVFGRRAEDFVADPALFVELAHPEDRARFEAAWHRLREGEPLDIEYRILWPNGAVRWINQRARAIRTAAGGAERIDGIARDVTEQSESRVRIRHLALYDQLTGLANRTLFHERLAEELAEPAHSSPCLGLALIDLDRFKAINDAFGVPVGDEVLKAVAQRLADLANDPGRVARLGSDLFAIKFFSVATAEEVGQRLQAASQSFLGAPFNVLGREVRLSARCGIAMFPRDGGDPGTLLRNAEAALKRAKETGERYVSYTPEINAWVASRRLVGLEALMRWNGPDGRPVSPAKFVPILEQTGLILEAGRQALAQASGLHRRWRSSGLKPPRIAVNVSALQLRRQSFVGDVRGALVDAADEGGGVDLEITESLLMADVEETIRKLRELREMGLGVALDDFGTGYSSLSYLSRLPLDALKIDRAFVRGMMENSADMSIITSIVSLARALRLRLVAEGVESEQQANRLLALGCEQAQGYLFSRPVPAERIEPLVK
jgi:diguanylate cyclase (GGDEF)-like protein/PAS domain S-box-containing protein